MDVDSEKSLEDENNQLHNQLENANYKINMLTADITQHKIEIDIMREALRKAKNFRSQYREESIEDEETLP